MFIAITGGIGSGKSTAAQLICNRDYDVVDCDVLSRKVTEKGKPLLDQLARSFGPEILNEDGSLNRQALAFMAFADPDSTDKLNSLVQSAIRIEMVNKLFELSGEHPGKPVFAEVPLLYEAGWESMFDKVWLVTASEEVRIDRVKSRSGLSEEAVRTRMALQMPEDEKMARADEIIINDKSFAALKIQVYQLLEELEAGNNV